MRVFNQQIATNIAMNANYTSPYVPLKFIFMYAMAANVTGTPTGIIKLQASNDPETDDTTPLSNRPPTNWVDITNSSFALSASGETMWNVRDVAYNYVRVVYTDSSSGSSTATMNIVFNGKGQ